jgi:Putative prokaryotic signal transducing protein
MAYCPQCFAEYVENAVECMDCHVPLAPGPTPPPAPPEGEPNIHFVPVRLFRGLHAQFQADLAHNVLEAEGIPSSLVGALGSELIPGMDAVQLLVREEDQARASELVEEILNPPEAEAEAAADAGSAASMLEEQPPQEESRASGKASSRG